MLTTESNKPDKISSEVTAFIPFWLIRKISQVVSSEISAIEQLESLYAVSLLTEIDEGDLALGKVIIASSNLRKKRGLERLRIALNGIISKAQLTEVEPIRIDEQEPEDDNAQGVATHKISALIRQIGQDPEDSDLLPKLNHRNVVFASDVVARIISTSGEVEQLLNLSRLTDLGEVIHVQTFVDLLKQRYAQGSFTLQYDVANAATVIQRKKVKNRDEIIISPHIRTEAVRISVSFRRLLPKLIESHFAQITSEYADGKTLRDANIDPGINVGLPIFDEGSAFLEYIETVRLESLSEQGEVSWFEPYELKIAELNQDQKQQLFDALTVWIAYGIAPTAPMLFQ